MQATTTINRSTGVLAAHRYLRNKEDRLRRYRNSAALALFSWLVTVSGVAAYQYLPPLI